MKRALREFIVTGIRTTIPFHSYVFEHPAFVSGDFHTGFIEEHFSDDAIAAMGRSSAENENVEHIALAAALDYYLEQTALIQSNQELDREAGKRWRLVSRMGSSSYLPR
jgi:acetyl/propionyl-CoA carboxylase alpha subunit